MFPFANVAARASQDARRSAGKQSGDDAMLDRAPGLRDAAERVIVSIIKSMQTMAGPATTIEGLLAGFTYDAPRNIVSAHRPEVAAALVECPGAPCGIVVTLDATLVHALVELMCGGNGDEPPPTALRAVTPIDQQFAQIVFKLAAAAVQSEWAAYGFGSTRVVKIDAGMSTDIFGSRVPEVGIVAITVGAFGYHGIMRFMLPSAALGCFDLSGDKDAREAAAVDPFWSGLLHQELGRAEVRVDAYLEAKALSLGAIADLQVGQILALPVGARACASLVCDGRTLYRGEIGQADSKFSLRLDQIASEPGATMPNEVRLREPGFPSFDLAKA